MVLPLRLVHKLDTGDDQDLRVWTIDNGTPQEVATETVVLKVKIINKSRQVTEAALQDKSSGRSWRR